MLFPSNDKIYLICIIIFILVVYYFLINNKITNIVKEEINKIEKKKLKRYKMNELNEMNKLKQKQMMYMMKKKSEEETINKLAEQNAHKFIHEGDSYMDPLENIKIDEQENEQENDQENDGQHENVERARLTRDSMGMRDLEDGTR
jgi:hypothetical protein